MSTGTHSRRTEEIRSVATPRALALLGIAVLTAGYCSTLYWVTTVVGGTTWLAGSVAIGLGAGVLLRTTEERTVFRVAAVGVAVGGILYYTSAAPSIGPATIARIAIDTLAMLSGISVLRLAAVDVWIAALVPVPVFLSTYFALRRRYAYAAAAGGWIVCFLALTGDATTIETLLGTIGAVAAMGFGDLDRRDSSVASADVLVALLAVMAVLALAVPMVPSGSAASLEPRGVDGGDTPDPVATTDDRVARTPLDEQLLSGDSVTAGGPINLSSDVRFVVESPTKHRWRVGSLGTYTGDDWRRIGANRPYMDALTSPAGESERVVQQFQLRAPADDVPAVASPIDVRNLSTGNLQVTSTQTLTVAGRLPAGTNYTIASAVPTASESTLRDAGTDYPLAIESRYASLPNGTVSDRVVNLTDQITSQASTPYAAARAIEAYLEENKEYSQNVSAPDGTLTDSFLFEMDAGYCTYYAGSMATMLRTQGVPARVAVGYASGQWVGNDTWVVRGTDAHAWVEVYFPDVGWVEFDPTPTDSVRDTRLGAIEAARANDTASVDVPASQNESVRFERPPNTTASDGTTDPNGSTTNDTAPNGTTGTPGSSSPAPYSGLGPGVVTNGSSTPYVQPDIDSLTGSNEVNATSEANATNGTVGNASVQNGSATVRSGDRPLGGVDPVVLALLLVAGTVAGGRQIGVQQRLRHAGAALWQPRRDPETDVERAMERLDGVLGRRYEPRQSGETRREYRRRLPDSVGSEVERAFDLYEQARYAGEIDRATADELVGIVDGLARCDLPMIGRAN